jgi:D-threo-aldose 1-dehydrogenase
MESVELAPGVTSTRIGFGCAGLMRDHSAPKRQRLLADVFDCGINHFDVARMYGIGAAESELGRFARGRRDDIVIATKFGIEPASAPGRLARLQGPARQLLASSPRLRAYVKRRSDSLHQPHRYDAATARASLQTSLRELHTDHVDILLVHDPSPSDHVDLPGICAYLEEATQQGLVRAWGVAGERDPCVALKRSLPATAILQVRRSILTNGAPLPLELAPLITYGVLAEALQLISGHLAQSPSRRTEWSHALGVNCTSRALVNLLVRDALSANASGVVLFSTTRPERLPGLESLASPGGDDDILTSFRRLVGQLPSSA